MKRKTVPMLILLILLLGFIPRAVSLGDDMLSGDSNLWIKRSLLFTHALHVGNYQSTLQSGHPGVTRMWLSGISMSTYMLFYTWQQNKLKQFNELSSMKFFDMFRLFPRIIFFAKLPTTILITALIVFAYFLLRRLLSEDAALLASVLLALDPFFIAHSRIIQTDVLLATFMIISLLCLLVFLKNEQKKYLFFAGLGGGFALLTKSPALFLIPFSCLVIMIELFQYMISKKRLNFGLLRKYGIVLMIYIGLIGLAFFIFFPAMWVAPLNTANRTLLSIVKIVSAEVAGKAIFAHALGNFFMGRYVSDPGWLFYPIVLLFRSTPISFLFSIACIVFLIKGSLSRETSKNIVVLILFSFFFIIQMSLAAKKFDRYILPVFLILDILAAVGMVAFINFLTQNLNDRKKTMWISLVTGGIILARVALFVPLHPNYLAYYNPMAGGGRNAPNYLLVGIGEGLKEAADYLNSKPGVEQISVASWNGSEFSPFFKGKAIMLETFDKTNKMFEGSEEVPEDIDYIVLYINQIQRKLAPNVIEKFYNKKEPEHVVTINGIDYAWIYRNI